MNFIYNPRYPSVNDLKKRAKKRIPKFAYDYLVGGCNDEISLARNYQDISAVQLRALRHLKCNTQ
ncbi:L-lactate dehydrogenase (plasmid) [Piscirickettsia salmonis]|uniref:L-lactate dehydrogenase n=1 Tax=Piscirickettsia salmonis TaxID=1238 RepID=A0A9Q6LIN9_PISSA|nr:L-lactate dehydrogenase [Piscirickettsia salmonis]QGO35922.1 L-lactate dehydrogenase [Piscirickettsia salmonis]QGO39561.1 L-lactate dehydrogenase [Piscirickettsia salmonis]QGO61042.1 L-lactate dehydrogenase [Piscirickettsia salmonis]QGO64860.1 L-lactate dehydrogenase [Piscirickettsia salmonis]